MNYEIISSESTGELVEYVVISHTDGSSEVFPIDENNPRYLRWVAENN